MHTTRWSRTAATAALSVALVGCISSSEGEPSEPIVSEEPAPTEDVDAEPTEPEPTETDGGTDGASGDTDPSATPTEEAAPPLEGTPDTEPAQADPEWGTLAVTDVRVGTHDGFDRVVFEVDGDDGTIGWDVRYVDVPTSQGSGEEADVDGEAYLAVSISGVALPPDLPPGIEAFTQDVDGPAGGSVVEVVHDSIYEGYHLFFVGVDAEAPFVVERLEDPQRLVIDLHHG